MIRLLSVLVFVTTAPLAVAQDPHPAVGMVDTPTVKVLKGLTVPEFEAEMQQMNAALGVACGHCHVRGNFASDDNPRKIVARRMLEMTRAINQQFFPDYTPTGAVGEESHLGRVTCFTCHQGNERPKSSSGQ
jgi:photosynthetic reaction center cytochrome c subunit